MKTTTTMFVLMMVCLLGPSVASAQSVEVDGEGLLRQLESRRRATREVVEALTDLQGPSTKPVDVARPPSVAEILASQVLIPKVIETRADDAGFGHTRVIVSVDYPTDAKAGAQIASGLERVAGALVDDAKVGNLCMHDGGEQQLAKLRASDRMRELLLGSFEIATETVRTNVEISLAFGGVKLATSTDRMQAELGAQEPVIRRLERLLQGAESAEVYIDPPPRPRKVTMELTARAGATTMRVPAVGSMAAREGSGFELVEDTSLVVRVPRRGRVRIPLSEQALNRSAWLSLAALRTIEGAKLSLVDPVAKVSTETEVQNVQVRPYRPVQRGRSKASVEWLAILHGDDDELLGTARFGTTLRAEAQAAVPGRGCDVDLSITVDGPRRLAFDVADQVALRRVRGVRFVRAEGIRLVRAYMNEAGCESAPRRVATPPPIIKRGDGNAPARRPKSQRPSPRTGGRSPLK